VRDQIPASVHSIIFNKVCCIYSAKYVSIIFRPEYISVRCLKRTLKMDAGSDCSSIAKRWEYWTIYCRRVPIVKHMRLDQNFLTMPMWNATGYVHVDACGMPDNCNYNIHTYIYIVYNFIPTARVTFCNFITICVIVWFRFCRTVIWRPRRSKELGRIAAETHVMTLRCSRQRDFEGNDDLGMTTRWGADFQLRDTVPWLCRWKSLSMQIVNWPYGKLQKKPEYSLTHGKQF
jgi:hypothetical protein